MGIQYTQILRRITRAQGYSLDKDYSGHLIKRLKKRQEFGNSNKKAKSHSVDYPIIKKLPRDNQVFHSKVNVFARYRLQTNIRDDLKIHTRILHKSYKGILMNLLTYLEPTRINLTDAYKVGMGGFSSKGRAWRWKIPKEYWGRTHINLL